MHKLAVDSKMATISMATNTAKYTSCVQVFTAQVELVTGMTGIQGWLATNGRPSGVHQAAQNTEQLMRSLEALDTKETL